MLWYLIHSELYYKSHFTLQCLKVGNTGKVVGIEHIDELNKMSINNVKKWNAEFLNSGRLKLLGRKTYYSHS